MRKTFCDHCGKEISGVEINELSVEDCHKRKMQLCHPLDAASGAAEGGMSMSCEYCHEDRDGYIVPLDRNCHAWIKYPNLLVIKLGKERRECVIRYCPMCGRELKK